MLLDADDSDEFSSATCDGLTAALDAAFATLHRARTGALIRPAMHLYMHGRSKEGSDPIEHLLMRIEAARRSILSQRLLYNDTVRLLTRLQREIESFRRHRLYPYLVRLAAHQRFSRTKFDQTLKTLAEIKVAPGPLDAPHLTWPIDPQLLDIGSDVWRKAWPLRTAQYQDNAAITIIVPVYGARAHTLACLHSLLAADQDTPARLLVIDDCSPEPQLRSDLQRLASAGCFDLISHRQNHGFVSSVNHGILTSCSDVVLLNSDTIVCDHWLGHLQAAARARKELGSVSPLSNNATILSYPYVNLANALPRDSSLHEIGRYLEEWQDQDVVVEVPTSVGFCMYIPRNVIEQVGIFDEATFAHGYGEECDWAMRARQRGYRHYVATRAFVYHHGGVSFSERGAQHQTDAVEILRRRHPSYWPLVAEHVETDPLINVRRYLDRRRVVSAAGQTPVVLHVSHSLGGGTEYHIRHISKLLKARGVLSIFAQPDQTGMVQISSNFLKHTPNLVFAAFPDDHEFYAFLRDMRVKCIHLHHFMGFAPEVLKFIETVDIPLIITLHDFAYICPQIVLINQNNFFCGVPSLERCNQCIAAKPPVLVTSNVAHWRDHLLRMLVRAERILAPSGSAANLYSRAWPDLPITVVPHPEPDFHRVPARPVVGNIRTVAVVGTITGHKGAAVVEACVRDAEERKLPLKFVVVGELESQLKSPYLDVTGHFIPAQLPNILSELLAVIGFLPSVWPETYSYVLSSYYRHGLYPVVFDIGAQSERVKAAGYGTVLPLNSGAPGINNTLLTIKLDLASQRPPLGLPEEGYLDACYGSLLAGENLTSERVE